MQWWSFTSLNFFLLFIHIRTCRSERCLAKSIQKKYPCTSKRQHIAFPIFNAAHSPLLLYGSLEFYWYVQLCCVETNWTRIVFYLSGCFLFSGEKSCALAFVIATQTRKNSLHNARRFWGSCANSEPQQLSTFVISRTLSSVSSGSQ